MIADPGIVSRLLMHGMDGDNNLDQMIPHRGLNEITANRYQVSCTLHTDQTDIVLDHHSASIVKGIHGFHTS